MNNSVSIITPAYNSEKYLEATISSVLAQTHDDWEMLIVDDHSSDDTVKIARYFADLDPRITLIVNEQNMGQGASRNKAIKQSSGRYIAFLDSDDLWMPKKLEVQLRLMQASGAAFSHTSFGYIDSEGKSIKKPLIVGSKRVTYNFLLKNTEIGCLTAIYDTQFFGKVYMPDIRLSQDYVLWLKLLKKTTSLPVTQVLASYRIHDSNVSKNKLKKIRLHWKVLREYEEQSIIKSMVYLGFWAVNGFYKHFLR